MIATPEEYYRAVQRIDQDRIDAAIDAIPPRVNRAGKYYRKLIKEIYAKASQAKSRTV